MEKQTTVFYVDDNPKSRELLAGILKSKGFAVVTESDPWTAVERTRETEFELALLDYQMPGMTGPELARELKDLRPNVAVILISGLPALPSDEMAYVDVHLGRGTRLDHLLETLEMLACPSVGGERVRTLWQEST